MEIGVGMNCVSDYYIEVSFCMRSGVASLCQEAALQDHDECAEHISEWQLHIWSFQKTEIGKSIAQCDLNLQRSTYLPLSGG